MAPALARAAARGFPRQNKRLLENRAAYRLSKAALEKPILKFLKFIGLSSTNYPLAFWVVISTKIPEHFRPNIGRATFAKNPLFEVQIAPAFLGRHF